MSRKSSFEQTYFKCHAHIVSVIGRIVKSDDVEDLVQETFVQSYAADLKKEIQFERTYMLKTARNLALNHICSACHRKNLFLDDLDNLPSALTSSSLESQVESKERFLHFCQATDTLSFEVKNVFLLKKVYGMSQKDIAEYIGLSQSTVEKHVAKGLLQCSLYLQQLVNSDTEHAAYAAKYSETVNK